jgi:hypothetical protein
MAVDLRGQRSVSCGSWLKRARVGIKQEREWRRSGECVDNISFFIDPFIDPFIFIAWQWCRCRGWRWRRSWLVVVQLVVFFVFPMRLDVFIVMRFGFLFFLRLRLM